MLTIERMVWRRITGFEPWQTDWLHTRLEAILLSWDGTPYMSGAQAKKGGVDCIRFVAGVLDELSRRDPQKLKTLPPDAAMHYREGAITVMRDIRERYMPNESVDDGSLEPGDVIVIGPTDGGPGHAMIVGPQPNTLWHSSNRMVHSTGLGGFPAGYAIYRVYRMVDRERWL